MEQDTASSREGKYVEESLMAEAFVDEHEIKTSQEDSEQHVTKPTKPESREQWSILLNVLVVCFSFTLLFTAFISLQNLQSSLNPQKGLGLASLCLIYGQMMLSAIFVPPFVISRVGCKYTMVISMFGYFVYTAANYHSTWWTLIPASIIIVASFCIWISDEVFAIFSDQLFITMFCFVLWLSPKHYGTCAAPLWSAKFSYLTTAALRYAKLSGEAEQWVMARYFGLASCFFTFAHILGNLISSLVLQKDTGSDVFRSDAHKVCGSRYDQMLTAPSTNDTAPLVKPAHSLVITMLSVYLATSVLAVLIVACFLKRLEKTSSRNKNQNKKSGAQAVMATIHQHKDKRLLLVIPLSAFTGVKSAFAYGDFSVAYVTCTIGIHRVGYVMMVYGATAATASLVVGRVTKYIGIKPTILAGSIIYTVAVVILLLWKPSASYVWVIYVLSVLLGICGGLFETQVHAIYGHYFQESKEPAFASYYLWNSFGLALAFGYANYVTIGVKLCMLMVFLVVGLLGYLIAERLQPRNKKPLNLIPEEKPLQTLEGKMDEEVVASV